MKKTSFLKSLLVAAALCTGGSAWAAEVTETYDFKTFCQTNGAPSLTMGSGVAATQSGTSTYTGGDLYLINNPTSNEQTLELNNRFAIDYGPAANVQIRFMWRQDASSDFKRGLAGNWNGNGTANTACHLSILNLKAGDKVTITYAFNNAAAKPTTCAANFLTGIAADVALTSGTEYSVSSNGNLDLYFPNNNFGINSIIIKTEGSEEFDSNPVIAVTGANNGDRTITITSPKTNADNNSVTYYTKDGSTPSSTSTLYSGAFTVTTSDIVDGKVTIKAIAYKDGDTSIASDVTTLQLTDVGTTLTLNAPSIALSGFAAASGAYFNPTYTFTSNQSGVVGTPEATIKYSFAGGEAIEASSYSVKAPGRLTVTVSADGYNSNSAYIDVATSIYTNSYSFNAIDDVTVDTSTGTWDAASNVGGVQWTFTDLANCTYTLRGDITLTNFRYARATTAQTKQGFYARGGAGSIGFTLSDGEYIVFAMNGGSSIFADNSKSSQSFGQYSNVRAINVYSPATNVIGATDCTSGYRSAFGSDIVVPNGSAKKVTFKNHGSGTGDEFYKNWVLDINYGGSLVTTVRSDWHAFGVGDFTYGYTYSSDGGATADNTNVWGTWFTDNAESDVELTLSHVDGKLYVIGTITKGSKVYYVNYAYGDGTKTEDFTMNLSVDHSWIEVESVTDASTVTTPAHPTNVAVEVGTNGYATYANHVYPLDLTSAAAYKAAVAGDKVNFTLFGQAVPAGTGMLVEGTPSTTVNLPIVDASAPVDGNEFLVNAAGTTFDAEVGYNYFGMVKDSDPLTFGTFAPGTLAIPANKAYLKVAAGAGSRLIAVFGEETTSISEECSVKNEEFATAPVYNLNGQRVEKATKGLYIVNGKKVVVK